MKEEHSYRVVHAFMAMKYWIEASFKFMLLRAEGGQLICVFIPRSHVLYNIFKNALPHYIIIRKMFPVPQVLGSVQVGTCFLIEARREVVMFFLMCHAH